MAIANHTQTLRENGRRWWTVAILATLIAVSLADRQALSMLVGPLKRDLGVGDFQIGLLLGPAFAVAYVICSLPLGVAVDRVSRRGVAMLGVLVWTLATCGSGLASSFPMLLGLRAVVGSGEAAITPTAHSLMGDLFAREHRAAPFSIFQAGAPVGAGLGVIAAGLALGWYAHHSNVMLLHGVRDWQLVFFVLAVPGLLALLLASFLFEPRQRAIARIVPDQPVSFTSFLRGNGKVIAIIFVVFGLSATVSYAQGAWTAEYVVRRFAWSKAEIGVTLGSIDIVLPLLTHAIMGFVVDYFTRRGKSDATLRIALVMSAIALPFAIGKYLVSSPALFITCYCTYSLLLAPTIALGAVALQQFTPPHLRGRMSASFVAFVNISGMTLGPGVTGAVSQFSFTGKGGLGYALTSITAVGVTGGVMFLWLSLSPLRAAITRAKRA